MRKINVIDLNKSESHEQRGRWFFKHEIFKLNLKIVLYSICRVFRLYSGDLYKQKVISSLLRKYSDSFYKEFALNLYKDLDEKVLLKVQQETKENTLNILLSASPNAYVKHLIEKLGWIGSGSYFDENSNFIHLHGKGKILWLEENFNIKSFNYNLAISDSPSDYNLLNQFNKSIKWISA